MAQLYRRKASDFLVNTETTSHQGTPSAAVLQDGGFVVAWTDSSALGADTSSSGIKAQRFDSGGNKAGGEFLVNTTTVGPQGIAGVAALPSGRFVVTWTDQSNTGGDTSVAATRGQLYEANGTPVGGEFLVNTETLFAQANSAVAELAGGGFVVSWTDSSGAGGDSSGSGIKAQLFDSSAAKVGGEILVNTVTQGSQTLPSIAALPSGGFAVAWSGPNSFNGFYVVGSTRLQIFDSAGAKVGAEQVVNSSEIGISTGVNIAALASGFVVTWAQQDSLDSPTSFDVRAQMYDSNGAKLGSEFIVNPSSPGNHNHPDAHALPGGGFIVTWQGPGEGASYADVFAQIFDSTGARQGGAFVVSSVTDGNQIFPEVKVLPNGDIVVLWSDSSETGGDSSGFAVKGQILTVSAAPPTDIALSGTTISETALEGVPLAAFSTVGGLNSIPTYAIVSDSSGGAFGIVGDKLVVTDNSLLDFETASQVQLRVRTTDENGNSYEETFQLDIADTPEAGYATAGGEFLVNTITQNNQSEPVMTALAGGGFLSMWAEWPLAGNGVVVGKGQFYNSDGQKVGGEVPIKGEAASALPGGGFVTTWSVQNASDFTADVKAQVYDSSGNPVGGEIPVNTTVEGYQFFASVAALSSGGFVVSWSDSPEAFTSEIRAQIFDSSGAKVGPELRVNTGWESEVAALTSGNFVVAWSTGGPIMAQIYTAAGIRFGAELEVSSLSGSMVEPHVTALAGGGFVVTYANNASFGMYTAINQLSAQVFDANGVKVGDEILIAGGGPSRVGSTDVAALPWGGFVVSWSDQEDGDPQTYDAGIRAQVFDSTGQRLGDEMVVNQTTLNDQFGVDVAVLASGDVVIGWSDLSGLGGDSSGMGVKARFLSQPGGGATEGPDPIAGGSGPNVLIGLGGDDTLEGLAGHDTLDGGAGADTMRGGTGNDVYQVDNASDVVEENSSEGTDEIRTGLTSYSLLGTNVEMLSASSNGNHDFRGSTGNNAVAGAGGNDFLRLHDGGNDFANGGGGHDVFLFGATLNAADRVDGGSGRDQIAIQGDYTGPNALTLGSGILGVESIAILSGADTRFGDPGTNFYDYDITMVNGSVSFSVQMIVDANGLRVGEDLRFNGSGVQHGSFFIFGGRGIDTLTGSSNNDAFYFGEGGQFGADDVINGGPGTDQLGLRGSYTIVFGENQLVGIDNIGMVSAQDTRFGPQGAAYNYNLTMHDGNAVGGQMTLDAFALRPGETLTLNASAETSASYRVFGGQGNDSIIGGQGPAGDILTGHRGADTMTGGGGPDTFRYHTSDDSKTGSMDRILDFAAGSDKIDLIRIDADTHAAGDQAFHWIGSKAFAGTGAASAGELRAYELNGKWFVEGDTDGNGAADLVIELTLQGPTLPGSWDFLL